VLNSGLVVGILAVILLTTMFVLCLIYFRRRYETLHIMEPTVTGLFGACLQHKILEKVKLFHRYDASATSDLVYSKAMWAYDKGLRAKFCVHTSCRFEVIPARNSQINIE